MAVSDQGWYRIELDSVESKGVLVLIMCVAMFLMVVCLWYALLCPCWVDKREGRFTKKQRLAGVSVQPDKCSATANIHCGNKIWKDFRAYFKIILTEGIHVPHWIQRSLLLE